MSDAPTFPNDPTEVVREVLSHDAVLSGIPCRAGVVFFYRGNRALAQAWLSEDFMWHGERIPKASLVVLDVTGLLESVALAEASTLVGRSFDAGAYVRLTADRKIAGWSWSFDPSKPRVVAGLRVVQASFSGDDQLESAILDGHALVQGVPCCKQIAFHGNGALKGAVLAEAHRVRGALFAAGTAIAWDEHGVAVSVRLAESCVIEGIRFEKHTSLVFDAAGRAAPSKWQFRSGP